MCRIILPTLIISLAVGRDAADNQERDHLARAHFNTVVQVLQKAAIAQNGKIPEGYLDPDTGIDLGKWAAQIRAAEKSLSDAGFNWEVEGAAVNPSPAEPAAISHTGVDLTGATAPLLSAAAPTKTRLARGTGKIDLIAFLRAVEEEGMTAPEDVEARFLAGHSDTEIMAAALGSVFALAPDAVRLLAGSGSCAAASDKTVEKLLDAHTDVCDFNWDSLSHKWLQGVEQVGSCNFPFSREKKRRRPCSHTFSPRACSPMRTPNRSQSFIAIAASAASVASPKFSSRHSKHSRTTGETMQKLPPLRIYTRACACHSSTQF